MNGWRRVPRANIRPMHCAVFPHLGAGHADGYVDVGTELPGLDNHVTISVHAARKLGEFVGMVDPGPLENRIRLLERENEELKAQVAEADKFAESAEYTLARFGAKVQKKPGRPKKELEAA